MIDAAVGGDDVNAPDVEAAHVRGISGAILQGGDGFVDLVVESGLLAFSETVTDEDDVEFRGRAAIDQNAGVGQAGRLHLHGHLGAGDERREGHEDERKKDPWVHGDLLLLEFDFSHRLAALVARRRRAGSPAARLRKTSRSSRAARSGL